jgi:glycyl-tRNA synthetase beta chain
MVFEFPELQGIMGEYYYKDIDIEVSKALSQHYLPKGRSDELPNTILSKIISLSDRFDNLASAFSLKLYPTGSSDPYGLRRSCIGIIRITESLDIKIDLNEILDSSFTQVDLSIKNKTDKESKQKAKHFILDRIKNYYVENGFSVNILNSVLETNKEINIKSISNKINAIRNLTGTHELEKGVEIFKRLKNITKNNNSEIINETLLTNNYEQDLYSEIKRIERFYNENSDNKDSEICLYEIIKSFNQLADFFENVLVMDKNAEIKNNRINLLTKFKNLISEFSNLSEL